MEVAARRLDLREPAALLVVLELELAAVADDDRGRQRGRPVSLGVSVPEVITESDRCKYVRRTG